MNAHLLENRLREQMRRENHLEIKQVDKTGEQKRLAINYHICSTRTKKLSAISSEDHETTWLLLLLLLRYSLTE